MQLTPQIIFDKLFGLTRDQATGSAELKALADRVSDIEDIDIVSINGHLANSDARIAVLETAQTHDDSDHEQWRQFFWETAKLAGAAVGGALAAHYIH